MSLLLLLGPGVGSEGQTYPIHHNTHTNVRAQIAGALNDLSNRIAANEHLIEDTAYAASWNGRTLTAPSQNAVYDKIESLPAPSSVISDAAYGAGWNGETAVAPSKNAVYDKIETMIASPADPGGWTTIIKAANQDVTNAGMTNDNDFSFSVTANAHYMVRMTATVSGNDTTGDYTCQFAVDAGTMRGKGTVTAWTTGEPPTASLFTMRANAAANTGTAVLPQSPVANIDDIGGISLTYSFMPSNTTTFRFKFGNGTPGIGRTSRTWKGSIMRYKTLD